MKWGKRYWKVLLFVGSGLRESVRNPHSDSYARVNLAMWALGAGGAGFSILFFAFQRDFGFFFWMNLVILFLDSVMVRHAIAGIFYRREIKAKAEADRQFIEVLYAGYSYDSERDA